MEKKIATRIGFATGPSEVESPIEFDPNGQKAKKTSSWLEIDGRKNGSLRRINWIDII